MSANDDLGPFPSLDGLRSRLGDVPRKLGWLSKSPLEFSEPGFLRGASVQDDPVKKVFSMFRELWKHGDVRWGRLLKANSLLYKPGEKDCPGELMYCMNPSDEISYSRIKTGVRKLSNLRELDLPLAGASQRVIEWWQDMNDDMCYHEGFKLPEEWTETEGCRVNTLLFHRGHLPQGFLSVSCLPVLVTKAAPHLALPIPCAYWPEGLIEWLKLEENGIHSSEDEISELREEREQIYTSILGPCLRVFHEHEILNPHVDVYQFQWDNVDRKEFAHVSGGMSALSQPGIDGDFERLELIFYTKGNDRKFSELVQRFAHFPWDTGSPIGPWDVIPLGSFGKDVLGYERFSGLMLAPALARPERPLVEALEVRGTPVRFLSVIPLTHEETAMSAQNHASFVSRIQSISFDLAFDPDREEFLR